MIYILLAIDIFLTVVAQLSLRRGALRLDTSDGISIALVQELLKNSFLLMGLVLFAISFFLYVFILSRLQLSVVYPVVTGAILILITAASHFLLKEALTAMQAVGILVIAMGIVLVLLPR
jgi:multidrug transporter EmrE-like cation transporter